MSRGRPREFDTSEALDRALALFAREGFEQASVQALAEYMGICKPSLYAAYGNKETLFIEAVRRYAERGDAERSRLLNEAPDVHEAIAALLRASARAVTGGERTGCLVVAEAASQRATYPPAVRDALADAMARGDTMLRERLVRAQHEGQLDAGTDVDTMVRFFVAVMSGMAVQARAGATYEELCTTAELAARLWRTAPAASAH